MTFTHALSTNNYGPAKFIVDASAANGTHTTIASALTSASSGDTIFIRPGTYTENLTLKAGVNLTAFACDALTPNVIINGKCTFTGTGSVSISGIQLQTNSDFFLAVTGSNASNVNLENCNLNCTNNTGISYTSSSSSSSIKITNCKGDIGTTGISLFSVSASGQFRLRYCEFSNSGNSTTASTSSSIPISMHFCQLHFPISTSSTGGLDLLTTNIACNTINATPVTQNGSGATGVSFCYLHGGTASALSVGASGTVALNVSTLVSSNAACVTGAGIVTYNIIAQGTTPGTVSPTTLTGLQNNFGINVSTTQPAFMALSGAQANSTGDGTVYTITFASSEVFDQNGNFSSPTFTAPFTGRYLLNCSISLGGLTASHTTGSSAFVTSNRTITLINDNLGAMRNAGNGLNYNNAAFTDMDAADTATINLTISGGTKVVNVGASSIFSGYLVC